jgi:hypothetical protein
MPDPPLDRDRIALGIRQPWAELIVRGIKAVEVRSSGTRVRGPIYIYASRRASELPDAAVAARRHGLEIANLPLGMIVGSIELVESRPATPDDAEAACVGAELLEGRFAWRLEKAVRFAEPVVVRFLPYGVWFYPFRPKSGAG